MKHSHALVLTAETSPSEPRAVISTGLLPPTATDVECVEYAKAMEKRILDRILSSKTDDYIDEIFGMLEDGTLLPAEVILLTMSAFRRILKAHERPSIMDLLKGLSESADSEG